MKIVVKENQSPFDVVVQYFGNIEAAFDFATANDICLSEDLVSGQVVEITESTEQNIDIADFFSSKKIEIATGYPLIEAPRRGIGVMKIGTNFIVT